MSQRFTIDGSEALELHLAKVCEQVRERIQSLIPASRLEGVALGGGYGRGEGGVLREEGVDQPYNDLEFFVFAKSGAHDGEALHRIGHELTESAGIEVEFKVMPLAKFRRSQTSMFYYDLVKGHRWIIGDESLFAGCDHHHEASNIPLHEATRLLMNRCSGLLYAKERLARPDFTAEDADFVARNLAKAQLAFGDVVLAAQGLYHWSSLERGRRFFALTTALPEQDELRACHAAGVRFKLHPECSAASREQLAARHSRISALAKSLWLWLESTRLGKRYETPAIYALSTGTKCPEQPTWRNLAVSLRAFGLGGLSRRYPRERLLRSLPLLLWGMTSPNEHAMVRTCLHCDSSDLGEMVQAYSKIWHRFN